MHYRYRIDEEWLRTVLDRQLQCMRRGRAFLNISILGLALSAILLVIEVDNSAILSAMILAATTIFILIFPPLLRRAFLRRYRLSPLFGQDFEVQLTDSGIAKIGPESHYWIAWSACVRAVEFEDGVLVYHGLNDVTWLPHATSAGHDPEEAVTFVRSKVPDFKETR